MPQTERVTELACNVCLNEGAALIAEEAWVRSNVRAFSDEVFRVWRCSECSSIHAGEDVDLPRYYADYPFHSLPVDWRTRAVYDNQLRRLKRAGLRPEHTILDYGCGGGDFVRHLKQRGYQHVFGYDEYSEGFADRAVLERNYDCVFAQDLIEHVASPRALLDEFDELAKRGGIIAIGTPNASALDLVEPERTIHALHQPYHRHILSKRALIDCGHGRGWELDRYFASEYGNTPVPFINAPFMFFYMRTLDNSIDSLFESPKWLPLLWRLPLTLFLGFCGYFIAKDTDIMAIFRKP